MFLCHFFRHRVVVIIVLLVFISTMVNYQVFSIDSSIPYIFLNNYIILSHAIYSLDTHFYVFLLSELLISLALIFIIRKLWFVDIKKYRSNVNIRSDI